jgi:hypothetical protein
MKIEEIGEATDSQSTTTSTSRSTGEYAIVVVGDGSMSRDAKAIHWFMMSKMFLTMEVQVLHQYILTVLYF